MPSRGSVLLASKSAVDWVTAWIESCAHHCAAALFYERLSRLSDAELAARGLDRATLVHDLIRQLEGTPQPAAGRTADE
jgi:hypothetical protein